MWCLSQIWAVNGSIYNTKQTSQVSLNTSEHPNVDIKGITSGKIANQSTGLGKNGLRYRSVSVYNKSHSQGLWN
jgi:hypothetical protein